jgi:hypothetical protein
LKPFKSNPTRVITSDFCEDVEEVAKGTYRVLKLYYPWLKIIPGWVNCGVVQIEKCNFEQQKACCVLKGQKALV